MTKDTGKGKPVLADKGQIQQVISNLVINARQAMPTGGQLHITIENADLEDASIPTLRPGRHVKVTVQDEGEGIKPTDLAQIFDPYFTTKETGSGLGLATIWSIINKHSGHIGVASELGEGATFTFYLPASSSPLSAETESIADEYQPLTRSARILVMDDEERVCRLAAQILTRYGYSVTAVLDGDEAIAMYRHAMETGKPFDVVIMDLTIPGGIGGTEALQDILTIDPHVRAIVSSGYAENPVMADPAAYGFKDVLAKPYTSDMLCEVVARVLA